MKRQRQSERERKEDRLSDLSDCVLLHIMNFMNTKYAVRTCVLSTRWKDLWKRLTDLTLDSNDFRLLVNFSKFVSSVLSRRDGSISLHNVALRRRCSIEPRILNSFIKYAVSHGVQQLTLGINSPKLPPCIFSCQSLTFLKLTYNSSMPILPKSLEFPALKVLHLQSITFTASDNGFAEPFSTCNMLNTLVINGCFLRNAKVLSITNSNLSNLTIDNSFGFVFEVALCTPNLNSLTIKWDPKVSSVYDLPFLEEVNIDAGSYYGDLKKKNLDVIRFLQVLANVIVMTLSLHTLEILHFNSESGSMRTQPPCFVRLKSVKVNLGSFSMKSDKEVSRMVDCLLRNSPPAKVNIIRHA